jgi:hypothetical protein
MMGDGLMEGCVRVLGVVIMGWDDAKVALIAFCSGPWLLFLTKGRERMYGLKFRYGGCQPFDIFWGVNVQQ